MKFDQDFRTDEPRIMSEKGLNETMDEFVAVELLSEIKKRYPDLIRKQICSIRFYQTANKCFLEISEDKIRFIENNDEDGDFLAEEDKNYSVIDRIIQRQDLEYISAEDHYPFFLPGNSVEDNTSLFLELIEDIESCLNCFREIFSEDGIKKLEESLKS